MSAVAVVSVNEIVRASATVKPYGVRLIVVIARAVFIETVGITHVYGKAELSFYFFAEIIVIRYVFEYARYDVRSRKVFVYRAFIPGYVPVFLCAVVEQNFYGVIIVNEIRTERQVNVGDGCYDSFCDFLLNSRSVGNEVRNDYCGFTRFVRYFEIALYVSVYVGREAFYFSESFRAQFVYGGADLKNEVLSVYE